MRQAHSEGVATHDKAIAAIERDSRAFGDDHDDDDDGTQVQYERPTRGVVIRALSYAYIMRCKGVLVRTAVLDIHRYLANSSSSTR